MLVVAGTPPHPLPQGIGGVEGEEEVEAGGDVLEEADGGQQRFGDAVLADILELVGGVLGKSGRMPVVVDPGRHPAKTVVGRRRGVVLGGG
jgi:hypothetical protein